MMILCWCMTILIVANRRSIAVWRSGPVNTVSGHTYDLRVSIMTYVCPSPDLFNGYHIANQSIWIKWRVRFIFYIFFHRTFAPPHRFGPSRVGVRGATITSLHIYLVCWRFNLSSLRDLVLGLQQWSKGSDESLAAFRSPPLMPVRCSSLSSTQGLNAYRQR